MEMVLCKRLLFIVKSPNTMGEKPNLAIAMKSTDFPNDVLAISDCAPTIFNDDLSISSCVSTMFNGGLSISACVSAISANKGPISEDGL